MVVDSSAVIAILIGEAESSRYASCIAAAQRPQISMVSVIEVAAVSLARLRMSFADVLTFLGDARVAPVSVDERQMRLAGDALISANARRSFSDNGKFFLCLCHKNLP